MSVGLALHEKQLHLGRVEAEVSGLVVNTSFCFTAEVAEAALVFAGQEAVFGSASALVLLQSRRIGLLTTAEADGLFLAGSWQKPRLATL